MLSTTSCAPMDLFLFTVGIQCSLLAMADPVGDFPNASLTIMSKPIGNGWPTMTALNIEGHTEQVCKHCVYFATESATNVHLHILGQ